MAAAANTAMPPLSSKEPRPKRIVASDDAGERVDAPQLALDADGVGVGAQHDRLADGIGAAKPRDQMRLAWSGVWMTSVSNPSGASLSRM